MTRLLIETLLHTAVFPGTVLVVGPYLLLAGRADRYSWPPSALQLIGLAPIVVGAAIGLWCTRDFIVRGKGTPNPLDPPKLLVRGGLYRSVRNPMYVAVLLILAGEAILAGSLALLCYATGIWLLFHLVVVLYEEPALRAQFGDAYVHYCRQVRRWIPRLPHDGTRAKPDLVG